MSFGLGRGRALEPGTYGLSGDDLPPLPDDVLDHPEKAHLDPRDWFQRPDRQFELEIGSGKGTFLVQQAALQPETNFLGIEWAHEFCTYAADRVRRHGFDNVLMMHTDATQLLRWRIPDGVCGVVHLYFSDPWPKSRHHKRRVVQDGFLEQCHRVLVEKGELRIVTDHADYWAWMEEHFDRWTAPDHAPRFDRKDFVRPDSAGDGEVVGTNFERKYIEEGRPFYSTILLRA
ncbi:MAG: tRNA (guanosine(46)-N7)-methyltransferase TrmB [Planctomycetota bacterium]